MIVATKNVKMKLVLVQYLKYCSIPQIDTIKQSTLLAPVVLIGFFLPFMNDSNSDLRSACCSCLIELFTFYYSYHHHIKVSLL